MRSASDVVIFLLAAAGSLAALGGCSKAPARSGTPDAGGTTIDADSGRDSGRDPLRDAASSDANVDGAVGSACGPCEHGQCVAMRCECDLGFTGAGCSACALGYSGADCKAEAMATAPAASVTAGVAPLGVFFDASVIAGLAEANFLEAEMRWDFGDASAGTYATTGLNKNRASGFVTGHVFEAPGTYTVNTSIVDVAGKTWQAEAVTVVVSAFDGESRCVSSSGDFASAPAGCDTVTSSDVAAQLAWAVAGDNRRLLLRRGESFSLTAGLTLEGAGPTVIGAFGPDTEARPRIDCNNLEDALTFAGNDVRVVDLELARGEVRFTGNNQVALRLDIHDGPRVGVGIGGRQVFVADSRVVGHGYFSGYIDGSRMSLTGNTIDQLRVATSFLRPAVESRDVYIAHNVIDASRAQPTTGIKWHSRRGVITDNVLVAGLSRIAITTDSGDVLGAVDEDLGVLLVERNVMRLSFDAAKPANDTFSDAGISFNTHHDVVLRTNVMSGMSRAFVDSSSAAEPVAERVRIYNNSISKVAAPGVNADEGDFLSLQAPPRSLHVFNNAIAVDESAATGMIRLAGGLTPTDLGGLTIDHNLYFHVTGGPDRLLSADDGSFGSSLSDWQMRGFDEASLFTTPGYQSVDPDAATFLQLGTGSAAIDAGQATAGAYDFAGHARVTGAAIDVGAFEHDAD